ncbi:MAG TPA: hypothetical protein VGQ95_11265 [Chthoniobacterales bacterium]|nr:hypothetical protein [Chthoniobacterales bacterium]
MTTFTNYSWIAAAIVTGILFTAGSLPAGKTYPELMRAENSACQSGDFDRAIELCNAALAMKIGRVAASLAIMRRGNAYFMKKDFNRALRDHDEAIRLDPKNAAAYVNHGLDMDQRGEFEKEMKDYAQAIRIDSAHWRAYLQRAAVLRYKGRVDEAAKDIAQAIRFNPRSADNFNERALIKIKQRQFDQAMNDCDTALRLNPKLITARITRVVLDSARRNESRAREDLEAIAKLDPNQLGRALNSIAWFQATFPDSIGRDGAKAVAAATRACELSRWKNWRYIDTLAAACAENSAFDQALKYEKLALEVIPAHDVGRKEAENRLELYRQHKAFREEVISF